MNQKILAKIPVKKIVKFEQDNELANSNHQMVKIYIMHTGENYNGSVFSEESIDCSIDTLSNIPILAYVEKTSYEEKDFKGHETDYDIFEDEDGRVKVREYYKEQAIGVIPESNEWFKEEIDGEIYLGCYGRIWKCYSNDAYDILLEDRKKEVSMEILVNKGSYDIKGRYNIDEFEFLGVTVLGASVPGAMGKNCELSMDFSAEEQNEAYTRKLNRFREYFGKESVNLMSKENKKEFEQEQELEQEGQEEQEQELEQENFEEQEQEGQEEQEEFADDVCPECGKNPCVCDEDKDEEDEDEDEEEKEEKAKKKKCSKDKSDFSLSLNNIFRSIRENLESEKFTYTSFWGDSFEVEKYWVEDLIPSDNIVILYDREDGKYYGVEYAIDKDTVSCDLDNRKVYIQEWRAREEGVARFESNNVMDRESVLYNMIAEEYHNLKEFKSDTIKAQAREQLEEKVNNIVSQFEFKEEEIEELVSKVYAEEMDLEMFENMLFALEGRKAKAEREKFAKANEGKIGLPVIEDEDEAPKGKYSSILDKYGKKRR